MLVGTKSLFIHLGSRNIFFCSHIIFLAQQHYPYTGIYLQKALLLVEQRRGYLVMLSLDVQRARRRRSSSHCWGLLSLSAHRESARRRVTPEAKADQYFMRCNEFHKHRGIYGHDDTRRRIPLVPGMLVGYAYTKQYLGGEPITHCGRDPPLIE